MKKLETLRQLQLAQVYIYRELAGVCAENDLKVYLFAGTLLGALRHGGFIPWDDDLAVCMSRPDYNRLLEVTKGRIGDRCRIIDPASETDFKGCIPLVVYENSKLYSEQFRENEDLQIGISIFVIDGVPKTAAGRFVYFNRMYLLRAEHALCRANFKKVNTKAAKIVGPVLSPFFNTKSVWKYKKKILKFQQKYSFDKSELVSSNVDVASSRKVVKKSEFEVPAEMSFEGIDCQTFSCYKEFLTNYYGDYMTPPPEAAQKPKHSVTAEIEDGFNFDL